MHVLTQVFMCGGSTAQQLVGVQLTCGFLPCGHISSDSLMAVYSPPKPPPRMHTRERSLPSAAGVAAAYCRAEVPGQECRRVCCQHGAAAITWPWIGVMHCSHALNAALEPRLVLPTDPSVKKAALGKCGMRQACCCVSQMMMPGVCCLNPHLLPA
jgi:hypothetical protein